MNRTMRLLLALGLILAIATPALAELKFGGFYQTMFYSQQLKAAQGSSKSDPMNQNFVDQRLRFRPVYSLNDNVAIVYYGEIDTTWGEFSKGGGPQGNGGGGKYDTDGVNVETKNVYLDLKTESLGLSIGLFNRSDEFQGMIYGSGDMAGINGSYKIGDTNIGFLYSKWDESSSGQPTQNVRAYWDDTDFYGLILTQKFGDSFKAGISGYYLDNNNPGNTAADLDDFENWYYGLFADAAFGNFGVDGFVLFENGTYSYGDSTKSDLDNKSWVATVKAKMKLENGDLGLRAIYIPEDDSKSDNEAWFGNFSQYDWVNENQMIFLTDKFVANAVKQRYAIVDSANTGYGLMAFVLSGNHKLPYDMYLNWGAGYYMSADKKANIGPNGEKVKREGDTLGYEGCVRIGKKFFEKVDVSLNGAYASFGDFYDDTVDNGSDDPDDIYKTYLMVRVPF